MNYNVVVIHLNLLRSDFLSFNKCESISTPGFDTLAREGVYYKKAYSHIVVPPDQLKSFSNTLSLVNKWDRFFSFQLKLKLRKYNFANLHFSSHDLEQEKDISKIAYPRFVYEDDDYQYVEKNNRVVSRKWTKLLRTSKTPFVVSFTSDELLPPFHTETESYSQVHEALIKTRTSHHFLHDKSNNAFRTSVYQENRWIEMRRTYMGQLLKVDRWIQNIIEDLKSTNRYDQTLIIAYGKGTPALGDFGYDLIAGHEMKESYAHVPLFVKYPKGTANPCINSDNLVSLVDVWPTVYSLFDLDYKPSNEWGNEQSLLTNLPKERVLIGYSKRNYLSIYLDHSMYFKTNGYWYLKKSVGQELYESKDKFGLLNQASNLELLKIFEAEINK